MATPGAKFSDSLIGDLMAEQDYKVVLETLAQHEAMPFLELSALIDMDDNRLEQVINDLERRGIVKVTGRGNILDEIVTLRDNASALTSAAT